MKSEEELYKMSSYYKRFKRPMTCPYCGSEMIFHHQTFYEGSIQEWICPICGLIMDDSSNISKERLREARRSWRKYLKRMLVKTREELERIEKAYSSYGKFMSPEEKREILGELLEESNEGTT